MCPIFFIRNSKQAKDIEVIPQAEIMFSGVECPALLVDNASLNPSSGTFEFEDTVTVTCDVGYQFSDGINTTEVECTALGTWNAKPNCISE